MNLPTSANSSRFLKEWLALGIFAMALGFVLWQSLQREHSLIEAQEGEHLSLQTQVINDNLIQQLDGANKAMAGIRDDLGPLKSGTPAPEVSRSLKLLSDAMPGVSTMLVFDASGTAVAASRSDLLGRNFREREYFDAPRRDRNPSTLYVSPPFRSALDTFVVVISRAILDARGEFAGAVTATLDPAYYKVLLQSANYAPDMRSTLVHGDGKVVLNMPVHESWLGADLMQPGSLFTRLRQSGKSTLIITSPVLANDGDRMVAMRTVIRGDLQMNKPLVIAVSRSAEAVYAEWKARATRNGILFAILVTATSAGLFLNHRRRRAFERIERAIANERQVAAERVEIALRGADLGLWDIYLPTNRIVVNHREREMLGIPSQADLPQGDAWRRLIHRDDWAKVESAFLPHARGETPSYECEHRMQHRDGHWIWIFTRAMIVERDENGAPARIVGTHLDISERKRAEAEIKQAAEQLRASREQLIQVTDNLPALVSILDTEQRFRFANRAYEDWLGMATSSLIGRTLTEVYGEQAYSGFRHHVEAALGGNKVVYTRQMSTTDSMRQVEVTLVPRMDEDGAVIELYSLISDITARHFAELERARSEERLSLALEGSNLALFDWDIPNDIFYHSAQAAGMRGDPSVATTATSEELRAFIHPDDLPGVIASMKDAVRGVTPTYYSEYRLRRNTGEWFWIRASGRIVERDAQGRAVRLAGTYADINESKVAQDRLRELAEFDALTGLPNRANFNGRLRDAMARAVAAKPMALLFLDIDHFKQVNDTLGHGAGDELLKAFAKRMLASVRQADTVSRLAGDEFTVILEGLGGVEDAKAIAQKLVDALHAPIELAGSTVHVSASIGVAMIVPGEADAIALIRRADEALYEAKRRGRDAYFCNDTKTGGQPSEMPTNSELTT